MRISGEPRTAAKYSELGVEVSESMVQKRCERKTDNVLPGKHIQARQGEGDTVVVDAVEGGSQTRVT